MPYVGQDERALLGTIDTTGMSVGQLNFVITTLVDRWIGESVNYYRINQAIGVLECAKLEAYRRIAVPYEDQKLESNGDVYLERD